MAKGKDQLVVKHEKGWAIKGSGNEKATVVTSTQKEEIQKATEIAKNKNSEIYPTIQLNISFTGLEVKKSEYISERLKDWVYA